MYVWLATKMYTYFKAFAATATHRQPYTSQELDVITSFRNSPSFCALAMVEFHTTDKGFKNIYTFIFGKYRPQPIH